MFSTAASNLGKREIMNFDIAIIGGGPAGLSTSIRLKQLAQQNNKDIDVCIIEKGAEIGSHIISGNVFNPRALNELIPDWKSKNAPINTPVSKDELWFLTEKKKFSMPYLPYDLRNDGNYIISLGSFCKWLGEQAEQLGVMILPGFSGKEIIYNNNNEVIGIATSDVGLLKNGEPGPQFQRGAEIHAKQIILSEGCRGSLSQEIMEHYNLRSDCDPQMYGLGFKEVWEIDPKKSKPGTVIHILGHPTPKNEYGGSFIYHANDNKLFIGLVMSLDYKNPYINPYMEFQKLKLHPAVRDLLENGSCISYGARCINEGGYQAIPKLTFPGGLLAGCSAGFVNVPKIKGAHYAMKSGMIAAEEIYKTLFDNKKNEDTKSTTNNEQQQQQQQQQQQVEVVSYEKELRNSWIVKELYNVRNVFPAFHYGTLIGLLHSALTTVITYGKEPWTLKHEVKCSDATLPKAKCKEIIYNKPDNKITFDILTNLQRTNTYHHDTAPSHLKIKEGLENVANHESYEIYGGPESRFCPARVYEFVEDNSNDNKNMKLVINSQNCIHCKACSIKTPKEYIRWEVPQGGDGPKYSNM